MMTKKKAAVLASLSASAPLLLFAAKTLVSASLASTTYRAHKCTACATEVAFGAPADGVSPFCPACGGDTAPVEQVVVVEPQEELLTSVGCPHCAMQNVAEDRMLAALKGDMHCAACGNAISYKAVASDVEEQLEVEKLDANDGPEQDIKDETASTKKAKGKTQTAADDETDLVEDAQAIAKGISQGAEAVADALSQHAEDVGSTGYGDSDVDDDGNMDVDLSDVTGDDDDDDVDMSLDNDSEEARVLAFVNGVHTMTLEKADAGENADVMVQTGFLKSMQREAKKSGIKALAAYGFKGVTLKLPINKIVEQRVQAALAAEKAVIEAATSDLTDNFNQCATIAAVALTQNFYKNRTNPIQDSLVASLESMGFKQAKQVVRRTMAHSAPQFVTAMLELASELMTRSVDSRNELSDTLAAMNLDVAATTPAFDEDAEETQDMIDSPDQLVARLTSGVEARPSEARAKGRTKQVASASGLSHLGSRLRQLKSGQ